MLENRPRQFLSGHTYVLGKSAKRSPLEQEAPYSASFFRSPNAKEDISCSDSCQVGCLSQSVAHDMSGWDSR